VCEAAEILARKKGFGNVTTTDIARAAGVSIGTLYRYFPDKEAILAAIVGRAWTAGLQAFGERVAILKPQAFDGLIEDVVHAAFDMVASRREELGKMHIELENVIHLSSDSVRSAMMLVQGVLERRRGELQVADIEVASVLLVRTVVFLARVGVRDHADLVASGRYANEIATMVRLYLMTPRKPNA